MKKSAILSLALALGCMSVYADDTNPDLVNNYMRSSIYTLLINSNAQNARIDEETMSSANADLITGIAKGFAGTDEKKAANGDANVKLSELPMSQFLNIEIPNQFNDHNLADRILDFDALREGISPEEAAKYKPQSKTKKFGKFAKGLASATLGSATGSEQSSMVNVDDTDDYIPAVLNKYFTQKNVAPNLLAKWYSYDPANEQHWSLDLVTDRGQYNFSKDDLAKAKEDQNMRAKVANTAFSMINNTYVVALNLKFRSYQAVVQEAAAMAKAAGSKFGDLGVLASQAASAGATMAAGDGFTVQAKAYLYKLKWNDDLNQQFAVDHFMKNSTLEDLISAGICELEYVGAEKSSANVRQSIFSDKPMSDLVKRATARAIDGSIANLQAKNEVFRTVMPIIGGDGQGTIYAAIGMKEGLAEKDEYEILEAQEDEQGKVSYKAVGTVKPVKGKIWNNVYGAEEEAAENAKNAQGKAEDFDDASVSLGHSEFKGKKGDYTGYYLRLKKKS